MKLTYMGMGGYVNIFIQVVKKIQELVSPTSVWLSDHACVVEVSLQVLTVNVNRSKMDL